MRLLEVVFFKSDLMPVLFYGNVSPDVVNLLMICCWNLHDCSQTKQELMADLSGQVSFPLWVIHGSIFSLFYSFISTLHFDIAWKWEVRLLSDNQYTPLNATHTCSSSETSCTWSNVCITTGDHMGCAEQPCQQNRQWNRKNQPDHLRGDFVSWGEITCYTTSPRHKDKEALQKICTEIGWELIGRWMAKDSWKNMWGQRLKHTTSWQYAVNARHGVYTNLFSYVNDWKWTMTALTCLLREASENPCMCFKKPKHDWIK